MSTHAKTTTWFRHPISKIIGLVQDDKYCTEAESLMTCVLVGKISHFVVLLVWEKPGLLTGVVSNLRHVINFLN